MSEVKGNSVDCYIFALCYNPFHLVTSLCVKLFSKSDILIPHVTVSADQGL